MPKSASASARASSVLPTPVGPRKRNEPIGPARGEPGVVPLQHRGDPARSPRRGRSPARASARLEPEQPLAVAGEQARLGDARPSSRPPGRRPRALHRARALAARARAGEVEHGDRLVRQEAVGDVAGGERRGGLERLGRVASGRGAPRSGARGPVRILTVSATDGSLTSTGVKRRSSAGSFSMCWRYSSCVVAPMQGNSPRASAALSSLAASCGPSPVEPAPMSVWTSSMKTTTRPSARRTSSLMPRSFSENDPRSCVPATSVAMSSSTSDPVAPARRAASRAAAARCPRRRRSCPRRARPPGSGLLVRRLPRTSMTSSISRCAAHHRIELPGRGELGQVPAELREPGELLRVERVGETRERSRSGPASARSAPACVRRARTSCSSSSPSPPASPSSSAVSRPTRPSRCAPRHCRAPRPCANARGRSTSCSRRTSSSTSPTTPRRCARWPPPSGPAGA